MPLFYDLKGFGSDAGRVAQGLSRLRSALRDETGPRLGVPQRNVTDTLLIATWNIQAFRGGYRRQENG